jgi:hypothetical protein
VLRQNVVSRRHTQMRMPTQHTPPNDNNNEHPHTTRRSQNALQISNTTTTHAYRPRAPHTHPASHHTPQTMEARLRRRHLVLTHVLVACACLPTTVYCILERPAPRASSGLEVHFGTRPCGCAQCQVVPLPSGCLVGSQYIQLTGLVWRVQCPFETTGSNGVLRPFRRRFVPQQACGSVSSDQCPVAVDIGVISLFRVH